MIVGIVNSRLEATIPVTIFGPGGQQQAITAVIDTAITVISVSHSQWLQHCHCFLSRPSR
jgi:hypothetical protein